MPTKDCYDEDTQEPISRPIRSLEELDRWRAGSDEFCVGSIPLAKRVESVGGRPRTLVCHDMAGGYIDDRLVQGSKNGQAYRFYHWQYVDTFVYFSHHFITIPPPCWINAAHKHGVPVLGTLITEWDVGRERCEQFLQTEENYLTVAEKLIQLAQYYKFDGWLINIENVVQPEKVYNLVDFVRRLTERIHIDIPNSQVVWYDSVISSGELKWQNELNDLNSGFFDSCDTIFLNYCWGDDHLRRTAEHASARGSLYDAFVGVDVFGRGCRGGGGFNTKEAVVAARNNNLSVALFAQGWVYEKKGKENFTENENRFWMLLHDMCVPHSSLNLPFCTTFCQGQGLNYYYNGKIEKAGPWTNLALQNQQPTHTNAQFTVTDDDDNGDTIDTKSNDKDEESKEDEDVCSDSAMRPDQAINIHIADAFQGGNCLRLSGVISKDDPVLTYRLFDANSCVQKKLYVSYSYKVMGDCGADVYLDLRGQAGSSKWRQAVLAGKDGLGQEQLAALNEEVVLARDRSVLIEKAGDGESQAKRFKDDRGLVQFKPLSEEMVKKLMRSFQSHMSSDGWTSRHYLIDALEGYSLVQVKVGVYSPSKEQTSAEVLLGKVQVMEENNLEEMPLVTDLHITDVELEVEEGDKPSDRKQCLTLNLHWSFPDNTAGHFAIYQCKSHKDADFTLIGHSHTTVFRVTKLPVNSTAKSPLFKVLPVLHSGLMAQLSQVPSVRCEQENSAISSK